MIFVGLIKKIKNYFNNENKSNSNISKSLKENNQQKDINNFSNFKKINKINNIFFHFKRRSTIKIIKYLINKKISNLFFYTDVNNITLILEQGIKIPSQIKLLPKQEYIVWTYLEHSNYLELELGNSTRHFFWKWCSKQNIDVNKIAIISININKLFQNTNKEWGLNIDTNRIQIYETIKINTIDWILVKDRKIFRLSKLYIDNQKLNLEIFQGNNDNINSYYD